MERKSKPFIPTIGLVLILVQSALLVLAIVAYFYPNSFAELVL